MLDAVAVKDLLLKEAARPYDRLSCRAWPKSLAGPKQPREILRMQQQHHKHIQEHNTGHDPVIVPPDGNIVIHAAQNLMEL